MSVLNIINLRLRSMYASTSVRVLSLIILVLIGVLISGLYQGASDATRLKIGVNFEKETQVTQYIFEALNDNEIIVPVMLSKKEGKLAVEEGRIQGFYIFKDTMEEDFLEGDFEEVVDVYYLEENFLPYLLSELVGSELIGEIAILKSMAYMEEVIEESHIDLEDSRAYFDDYYAKSKKDLKVEKDNFYIEKTYVTGENDKDLSYIALENVLLFKQVILGVVYIFVAFFMLFLVVSMVRDDETGLKPKWMTTPMRSHEIVIGEYLSIVVGSLPMVGVVTMIQGFYEDEILFFAVTNLFYVVAYAGMLMVLGKIANKVTVYVVVTSAVIIILGIVSGSFFLLNTQGSAMASLTNYLPTYQLLNEVVKVKLIAQELPSLQYMTYMIGYGGIAVLLAFAIDQFKGLKSM